MTPLKFVPPLAPIRSQRGPGQRICGSARHYATVKDSYPAQDIVIAYIEERLAAGGAPPTLEAIQSYMGWAKLGSVKQTLKRMHARGVIPAGFPWPM